MLYTFDFVDADGRIDHFDIGVFTSDRAAELAACKALQTSRVAISVAVWETTRKVVAIRRISGRRPQLNG